jgi:hypothetical protein
VGRLNVHEEIINEVRPVVLKQRENGDNIIDCLMATYESVVCVVEVNEISKELR